MSSNFQSSESYLLDPTHVKKAASRRKTAVIMLVATTALVALFGLNFTPAPEEGVVLAGGWDGSVYGNDINFNVAPELNVDSVLIKLNRLTPENART